jgi:hypothetical protein
MPHIVSVKKPKYVGRNGRGRNVNIDDRRGVNFAMVSGAVKGETPLYKGVRSVEVGPDVTRRCFTAGISSDAEGDVRRPSVMLKARWSRRCGSASALAWLSWLRVNGPFVIWYWVGSITSALTSAPTSSTA